MIHPRHFLLAIACFVLASIGFAQIACAATANRASAIVSFCASDGDKAAALAQIVALGVSADVPERAWSRRMIDAIRDGALVCTADGHALIQASPPLDASSLRPLGSSDTAASGASPYVPSIVMMRRLAVASAEIDMFAPQSETRAAAARQVDKFFALLDPAIVSRAIRHESDPQIAAALTVAMAKRGLTSEVKADRLAAVKAVAEVPSETAHTTLADFAAQESVKRDPELRQAVEHAIRGIDTSLAFGKAFSILFSGLSYAGVLLLTALGLSIVFGLMGVINLAHGEFIMIGAYSTYLVERFMQAQLPAFFDAYIFVAIPVAFVICAACGMLLEFLVIRFLYRRPLETLLATWAVSIALIKLVQLLFGSQNVEFVTPGFLNGGMQVSPGFFVTYNRVFAIALALLIFLATFSIVRFTKLGLLMRATTQLRDMARCLGVAAERVDRIAFGFGAGLAGLAGVVLTQIASVNPSMGTGFVVDSFMVVVLGGAGSLAGTVVSSLALGEINQFIEPFYGAVAAKVAVLLLIVLIIQKRPQGLFALKTRT
ncbi:urea transport system permease protein [Paraburkholderia sp. BL8N3]|jgi:urea transport system permease protein|nr:urea ABC transporter permease subunit UrtB [Paraburkholderia sp. BL8N3]TCK34972.1 urea transport system permease protein [Paraburkholderia sp. BL8N3]